MEDRVFKRLLGRRRRRRNIGCLERPMDGFAIAEVWKDNAGSGFTQRHCPTTHANEGVPEFCGRAHIPWRVAYANYSFEVLSVLSSGTLTRQHQDIRTCQGIARRRQNDFRFMESGGPELKCC